MAPERVRPSYHPIFRAVIDLIDAGKPVTFVNIAREVKRSRQAVWEMFKRHPDLWAWMDRQAQATNLHFAGAVVRRHAMLGMQGSVQSAELVLKFHGGAYGNSETQATRSTLVSNQATYNFLFPMPEAEDLLASAARPALPPAIPVVKVRLS